MNENISHFRASRKKERGQVVILFVLVFVTLFIFFAFVVNVGMVVHHKINLQQTADLAAYAGAAWQARAMNVIALENFRMRQDWKEFVFHIWITFGRFQQGFFDEDTKTGFPLAGQAKAFSPSVCLPCRGYSNFDQQTCYCSALSFDFSGIPDINAINPTDPIIVAAQQAINDIQLESVAACKRVQFESMQAWRYLVSVFVDPDDPTGAGWNYTSLYSGSFPVSIPSDWVSPPEGGLLYQRAAFLERLVENFNDSIHQNLLSANSTSVVDRLVRNTIRNNLNDTLLDGFSNCSDCGARVALPEPGPVIGKVNGSGGRALPRFLKLDRVTSRFSTTFAGTEAQANGACNVFPVRIDHQGADGSGVPVAYTKDESVLTYYAVRLRSRPRLLYLPETWQPTLTAFAAAKPFGGRMGPDVYSHVFQSENIERNRTRAIGDTIFTPPTTPENLPYYPNVSQFPFDEFGYGDHRFRSAIVSAYPQLDPSASGESSNYPGFFASSDDNGTNADHTKGYVYIWQGGATGPNDFRRRAVHAARAPNAYDALMYTIFPVPDITEPDATEENVANLYFPAGGYQVFANSSSPELWPPAVDGTQIFDDPSLPNFYAFEQQHPPGVTINGATPSDRAATPYADAIIFAPSSLTPFLSGISGGQAVITGNMIMSAWAPRDEVPSNGDADPFGGPENGRIGYSVQYANFRSLVEDQFFRPDGTLSRPTDSPNTLFSFGTLTDTAVLPTASETNPGKKVPH